MSAPPSTDPFIQPRYVRTLEAASRLHATNFFEPEWEAHMRAGLSDYYVVAPAHLGPAGKNAAGFAEPLARAVVSCAYQLSQGIAGTPEEMALYRGAALYSIADEFGAGLQGIVDRNEVEVPFYDDFVCRYRYLFGHPGLSVPEPPHLLAHFYQARRAWHFPASKIRGGSPSAAAARAAIVRANLGDDFDAYTGDLYRIMHEIPVLITGETGSGKELAAQCIGWSRYIPFDTGKRRFLTHYAEDFHPRSICEVPAELLESALFGHKRGAFTGAITDVVGFLGLAQMYGSLFLDEIGEIPLHLQAKLLRAFENREFVPIGEVRARKILGRFIFATHRDLEALCREGKFRPDLYERMNGFSIHMPPLRQMVAESPEEMRHYVRGFVAEKFADPARVEAWTERVVDSIRASRSDYAWPRNLRELKKYTERVILSGGRVSAPTVSMPGVPPAPRGRPETSQAAAAEPSTPESECDTSSGTVGEKAKAGEVSLEDVTRAHVTWAHVRNDQNLAATARELGLDYRTVSRLIDPVRLLRYLKKKKK